jgi:peptidoglycan/LPS O-acetylase OafA/YrhL
MTVVASGHARVRLDIQALRGIAVAAVILFHSGLGIAPSGYLGVDMFFVVSGFLISGIIMRQIGTGRFSFQDFYVRRIRRLLPAAYTVLAITLLAAMLLLTASAFSHYWQQFLGTLTFSTNIVLWRQINYFNNGAAFEPLLHMWSLAVEEQYYLLLPVTLFALPRRLWFAAILTATIASLAAYCWVYPRSPGAAFYLLPTRAWEIGIGSLATFVMPASRVVRAARRVLPLAALVVVAICFVSVSYAGHLLAIPACLAVAIVIVADHVSPSSARILAPLAWVGNVSYSLYLVHWPLFAFAHTIYMSNALPAWLSVALVVLTVVLAVLLYVFVEQPVRRSPVRLRVAWTTAIIASVMLAIASTVAFQVKRRHAPALDRAPVAGLENPFCTGEGTAIDPRCGQGAAPQILIWGDSLSQAITPAIDATTDRPLVEASKGQCAPLLGLAPVDRDSPLVFAKGCLDYNDSVLDYVARTPSIRVVVLSGRYFRLMFDGTRALYRTADGGTRIGAAGPEPMILAQIRTTAALRALGRRVVVISPPPQASFDIGACWDRTLGGLLTVMPSSGGAPACAIMGAGALEQSPAGARLMHAFSARAATPVIRLDRAMCSHGICPTAWNGVPLYVDAAHLNRTGSTLVGQRFALGARAWAMAR